MPGQRTATDWLLLASLVVMWGSAFALIRVVTLEITPLTAVAARLIIACGILYPYMRIQGQTFPRITLKGDSDTAKLWRAMIMIALLGNAIPFVLIMWAQTKVDSGLASIIIASAPLTTLLLAHRYVPAERMTTVKAIGFVTGFIGVCVLLGPQTLGGINMDESFWHMIALMIAAICYGASIVSARLAPPTDPNVTGTLITVIAAVALTPLAILFEQPWEMALPSPTALLCLVLLGVFSTGIGNIVFFVITGRAGATFVAMANYILPLWAVMLGVALFDEMITPTVFIGMTLILGGVALSEWRRRA